MNTVSHRSDFDDEADEAHTIGNPEALVNPTYVWVVFQRSETKPVEEMPITGVYASAEKAEEAAKEYMMAVDEFAYGPTHSDEHEKVWELHDGKVECVMARMVLDH